MTSTTERQSHIDAFRHEAVFYAGDEGFVRALTPFLRAGVAAKQPVFVVVSGRKIDLLRSALGSDAAGVQFANMAEVGRNPARIIPAWSEFVQRNANAPALRGVGEPIDTKRSPAELAECQRHEALLNLAFEGGPPLWLQCPYDTAGLDGGVLTEAKRSHPYVGEGMDTQINLDYVDRGHGAAGFDEPLPTPPARAATIDFHGGWLSTIRDFVAESAAAAGLGGGKASDLVLAINELTTNSLHYGGGRGTLRIWQDTRGLVCEVSDSGQLDQPLIGRQRPSAGRTGGRGLWMVNQLCDLVQIRSLPEGTIVRVFAYR